MQPSVNERDLDKSIFWKATGIFSTLSQVRGGLLNELDTALHMSCSPQDFIGGRKSLLINE
jgi:hypothetical protein